MGEQNSGRAAGLGAEGRAGTSTPGAGLPQALLPSPCKPRTAGAFTAVPSQLLLASGWHEGICTRCRETVCWDLLLGLQASGLTHQAKAGHKPKSHGKTFRSYMLPLAVPAQPAGLAGAPRADQA